MTIMAAKKAKKATRPLLSKWKKNEKHSETQIRPILTENTPFIIKEAYKTIRTNLIFALASSKNKRILITSAQPGEGKSTTSTNLAITFAQTNAKVLLIDAEMRKPTIYRTLGLDKKNGLSSILGGFCTSGDCIFREVFPNLDVITSGPIPPNPAELLCSPAMEQLLDEADENYDYIIIDTPPVNVVSDILSIAPMCAGTVLVVREGSTTHDQIQRAVKNIEFSNTKILGCVLTGALHSMSGYKNYRYRYKRYDSKYSLKSEEYGDTN